MKILILHRVPFHKIQYDRGIDHEKHDVVYVGTSESLENIPETLRCIKIVRAGIRSTSAEVIQLLKGETFDKVISLSEYELLEAALIREALGVQGSSYQQISLVRDKMLMKQAVMRKGIRTPLHESCTEMTVGAWSGKTVVKPVSGASSQNVTVHLTKQDAISFVNTQAKAGTLDPESYEIEEFINGPILHIDGLIHEGNLLSILASRYIGTCLGFAKGLPLGSVQLDPDPALFAWSRECLQAVEISDGAFHLEVIQTESGPVFLEVGARVGGADVVDTFELATGIHLPSVELKILTGEKIDRAALTAGSLDRKFGWFVFPGHHFRPIFGGAGGAQEFRDDPRIVRWNELKAGSPLPRNITYQSREVPVAGIAVDGDSSHLELFFKALFQRVKILDLAA